MKIWRKHTRSLLLSVCMLLMLLVMVPALQAEAAPSAKVKKNINKLISVIKKGGETNYDGKPVIQDDYDNGYSYYCSFEKNGFLYFGGSIDTPEGGSTDEPAVYFSMLYYYNRQKVNLEFDYFYSEDEETLLVKKNVKPTAIKKGKKVGLKIDRKNSSFIPAGNVISAAGEEAFQDAMKYWDALLYREAKLHMKDIGFTNYKV